MPLGMSRDDRRLLLAGGAVFVAILTVTIVLGGATLDASEVPTTYSVGSGGARAIYLLLPSLGYAVDRWVRPPDELTDAARTTLVLADPQGAPTPAERDALDTFLAHGGRVVATGPTGAVFLAAHVEDRSIATGPWTRATGLVPSAETRAAPSITLSPRAYWPDSAPGIPMYAATGRTVVAQVPLGTGEAYWWASATPLTNAGLQEPGNLEFVLAELGPPGHRRVLFDEYFHGARPTLIGSVLATPAKWLFVQLGLVALVVVLTYSRRSGPVVMPAVESRLSSLEYVRTMGSLYRRAGAAVVPVQIASRRLRAWVTRRLGLTSGAQTAELEAAIRGHWRVDADTVAATLDACDRALAAGPSLAPRQALAVVRGLDELYRVVQAPRSPDRETP
jgi:Domain of unknown function (DUF4350)